MHALNNKEIVQLLMDRGANLNIHNKVGYYVIVYFYFYNFVFEQYGQTALDIARNMEILMVTSMIFKVNYCVQ